MPKLTRRRLTRSAVTAIPKGAFAWDSELPGFGVRATASGKSFVLQFRTRSGRQGRLTLGGFPALTVEQARDLARAELAKLAKGLNPSDERRSTRQAPTVADLANHYCGHYAETRGLRERTVKDARRLLDKYANPIIGSRKACEIRPSDIRLVHGMARDGSGRYEANRLLAVLKRMFALSVADEIRPTNPCVGVSKFPEDERLRSLSEDEVRRLLSACDLDEDQTAASAVKLLLFTGSRLQEALKASWAQFDLSTGIWEKPSAHTKTKRIHRLQLDGPALELLREMRRRRPTGEFLFPGKVRLVGKRVVESPRADLKRPWERLKSAAGIPDIRCHDLRRTTASFMMEAEVPLPVIGSALGHTQIKTTMRYVQLRLSAQRDALKSVGERMMATQVAPSEDR